MFLVSWWAVEISYQVLYAAAVIFKVSAVLREAGQKNFDETLVPGGTHVQETVLKTPSQKQQIMTESGFCTFIKIIQIFFLK